MERRELIKKNKAFTTTLYVHNHCPLIDHIQVIKTRIYDRINRNFFGINLNKYRVLHSIYLPLHGLHTAQQVLSIW